MITVVNKKRQRVAGEYIGRGSPLGNPYVMSSPQDRDCVCDQYEDWINSHLIAGTPLIINELVRLANLAREGDLNLICFCAPERCHGDTVKSILDELIAS